MLPICAKKQIASKRLLLAAAASLALLATSPALAQQSRQQALAAPIPGAVTVSDTEFNTFLFPAPVKRILFPAGSPVVGAPVYMADNHQVLLQFAKGHKAPIQMVVELEGGDAVKMRVVTRSVPGITHAVNGARPRTARANGALVQRSGQAEPAARGQDVELLKQLMTTGQPPDGFDKVKLPAPTRFDRFTVIPLVGWSDTAKRIMVFSLVANGGQTSVVAPPQFYRDGITAVMLDGDVVDAQNSPQLFVVEELADE